MNKSVKKLCLLSIILIIISTIIIFVMGRTYELRFANNKNVNDYQVIVENEIGEVEVLDNTQINGERIIKIKAKREGIVYVTLDYGEYKEGKVVYVHKGLVITDNNYFGRSTWCEVIPISISIVLIYGIYLLIKKYRTSVKENLYQYKNIAYLGIIIFMSLFTLSNILSIFNYQGIYDTINKIINSMSVVSFFLFPIALVTFILVTISNINLIRKEGKSLKNLLGLFLGIFLCVSTLLPDLIYKLLMKSQMIDIYNLNSIGPYLYNFIESLVYLSIAYLECILIGTIIVGIKSVRRKVKYNKDYMIILGSQINKDGSLTPLLKGRADKAIEFRNKQLESTGKDLIFIPSGGKGTDEVISEGQAIKKYLLECGINEKNILVDNKSKNTYENIRNSYKLIKSKDANIGYSTTNYHVLRAGLIATEQGLKLEGIGSKTKAYFWINAFIREFIGTLYSEKKKHIIVVSVIIVILILMLSITYLANNI